MPSVPPRLTLRLADRAALLDLYENQLSKGRAFVPGAGGVAELEACDLVLEHDGLTHTLPAEAVFVRDDEPGRGVGLQLAALDAAAKADLIAFVEGAAPPGPSDQAAAPEPDGDPEPDGVPGPPADDGEPDEPAGKTMAERIRRLSSADQQRLAMTGTMQERILLERAFGSNVWEALLSNGRLTIPEVARIAKKGTLPRQMVEDIAGHASWVAAPEVQRALLANPRSTAAVVAKVLRALSRADLQLVPQQTAYPQAVRAAAKKMLRT